MSSGDDKLTDEWKAHLAPFTAPLRYQPGMTEDDAETLGDIRFRVRKLLGYEAMLPAGLGALLRDYLADLSDGAFGRWVGIGDPCQYARLADEIAQCIADGEWEPGERVYVRRNGHAPHWFCVEKRETIRRAMQLMTARGELVIRPDGFYVRPPR